MARKKLETLTEQMYYVLLSLLEEPRHGYGIMQYVSRLTDGRVDIGAGTLYALLERFEQEGLITLLEHQEGRKYYTISPKGRDALAAEQARLRRLIADGELLLGKEGRP